MKRILLLLATFLIAGSGSSQAQERGIGPGPGAAAPPPSAWQRYRVKNEEFSIAMPTMPAMTTMRQPAYGLLRKQITQRYLGVYADGVVYTIYSDDDNPQNSLTASLARNNMPAHGWEPSTEQIVNLDGVSGKQFMSSHPLGGVIQIYATKKHFYRIQA